MDQGEFCQKILNIDDKIRFVSIYDDGIFFHKMKKDKQSYLSEKNTQNSLNKKTVFKVPSKKS